MSHGAPPPAPDFASLTGVRSGKRSYYRAYRRSDERMQRAVRAMDSISRALVRTVEGPRAVLEEVVRAAAEHLQAEWALLALADDALPQALPRFLAVDAHGNVVDDQDALPDALAQVLRTVRTGVDPLPAPMAWAGVAMTLQGESVGVLGGLHGLADAPEPGDLSVLRILASQAAVSLHTSDQYQASMSLRRRAQQLYDEATAQARDLAARTAELQQVEQRLVAANQRELLDAERHRIARELHDSVTQYVLSAGMAVEVARGEIGDPQVDAATVVRRLDDAKAFTGHAVEQLRSAIYALHHERSTGGVSGLPDLLHQVAAQHRPHLAVQVRVEGEPVALGTGIEHELARVAGEALFNTAVHASAQRAVLRLRYSSGHVYLSAADDGDGDPAALRRLLRLELATPADGRHRGLANMATRAEELGGTLSLRRARLGGVRVEVRVPLPVPRAPDGQQATTTKGRT